MVKGYVRNKIKQAAIKAIDKSVKNNRIEKASIKGDDGKEYNLFRSDKQVYSLKDLDKDLKIMNKFLKSFKCTNAMQLYKNVDYINKNRDNKFFVAKGRYNVSHVYRNIIDYAKIKGKDGFCIDQKTIDRVFQDLELKADKQYNIMLIKIQKSLEAGYLDYDENTKVYKISAEGEAKAKLDDVNDNIKDKDFTIIYRYIKRNKGSISLDELKENLKQQNIKTVKKYCEVLCINGYLRRSSLQNKEKTANMYDDIKYTVTGKAIAANLNNLPLEEFYNLYKLNIFDRIIFDISQEKHGVFTVSELKQGSKDIIKKLYSNSKKTEEMYDKFIEYCSFRVNSMSKSGLLNHRISSKAEYYQTTDHFYNTLEKQNMLGDLRQDEIKIKQFHYEILKSAEKSDINTDSLLEHYKLDDRIKEPDEKLKIVKRTCEKLAFNGYLDYIDGQYQLTDKAREYLAENKLKISWADVRIYRTLNQAQDKLTMELIKSKISDKKEQGMFIGRLKKLEAERYIKYENDAYSKTAEGEEKIKEFIDFKSKERRQNQPQDKTSHADYIKENNNPIEKSSDVKKSGDFYISDYIEEQNKKSSLDNFKLQAWDKKNITDISENSIWSPEIYVQNTAETDKDLIEKRIFSIQKRLFTLEKMGLAEHIEDGRFYLKDSLYERISLLKEKGINKFSVEQKETIKTLAQFLNLTDNQIENFIYKENSIIFKSDLNYLLNKGYIEEYKRDLKNDGAFEKIYYLTTDGKKAASHLTGVKTDKIFSSKVKGRPVELRHDLLIYTAYKDLEEKLKKEGYRILNTMTDKQMKSEDMTEKGKQRIEYPDLHVEIEEINTGEKSHINIEVDCGYTGKVIKSKAQNIDNLVWYTDSQKQYKKIHKALQDPSVMLINL